MHTSGAVRHLDDCLQHLASSKEFASRLEYATDTHAIENWVRTEIAYAVSRDRYQDQRQGRYWAYPERVRFGRADVAIMEGARNDPRVLVELKMLSNKRGFGESNRRALSSDARKLLRAPGAHSRVLIAMLLFMQYRKYSLWPHRTGLADMDALQRDALLNLREIEGSDVAVFDVSCASEAWYGRAFAARFCRIILSGAPRKESPTCR